jgi:tetratricopeptide (TPR) repeat protein
MRAGKWVVLTLVWWTASPAISPLLTTQANACTIIMNSDESKIIVGNNEDSSDPFTWISFVPSGEGTYGRVMFSYTKPYGFAQGGVNDRGLFIDANALEPTGWKATPGKDTYHGPVNEIEYVLSYCATVEEAVAFFRKYNVPALDRTKFPLADATGRTAVVEWGQDGLQIHLESRGYQISTNTIVSGCAADVPCYRYQLARTMLAQDGVPAVDNMLALLRATHIEGNVNTFYSTICDLRDGDLYLYLFHDYDRVYRFNIHSELQKGRRAMPVASLFAPHSNSYHVYAREYGMNELLRVLAEQGIDAARTRYGEIKDMAGSEIKAFIDAEMVNYLGEQMLRQGLLDAAISFLEWCVEEFPSYRPAYLNLSDALADRGEHERARHYKKLAQALQRDVPVNN